MTQRVLFVVTGLHTGGAERQLLRLLTGLGNDEIQPAVVSLCPRGPVSCDIESLGVPLWHLDLERLAWLPRAWVRLRSIVRDVRPDVIQGWMYHGNLAALLARRVASRARLMFGIRQSLYDLSREKLVTRWVIRRNAVHSREVCRVVYNSHTARQQHEALGFARGQGVVIDNGFDTAAFRPDRDARHSVRRELGLDDETPLVGLVARAHAMKGHTVFLRAAERVAARYPEVHFLLAGRDVVPDEPQFKDWVTKPCLENRLHLLGERRDIPRLTAALDLACSSSWGEAFPNSLAEAMACGVPCVTTDVGDARRIVGNTGWVVPVGEAEAFAAAIGAALTAKTNPSEWVVRQRAARQRIIDAFGIDRMVARYRAIWRKAFEEKQKENCA